MLGKVADKVKSAGSSALKSAKKVGSSVIKDPAKLAMREKLVKKLASMSEPQRMKVVDELKAQGLLTPQLRQLIMKAAA